MSSDRFYVTRGEVKHHLSRVESSLRKFERQAQLPTSPTFKEGPQSDVVFDKAVVNEVVSHIGEAENCIRDLADTFAVQSSNAKALNLNMDELAKRKDIVEAHQKSLDEIREKFAYLVKGDPSADPNRVVADFYGQRQPSVRRHEVGNKENFGYDRDSQNFEGDSLPRDPPSRISMLQMKKQQFVDDDEDLVEIFERKAAAAEAQQSYGKGANLRRENGALAAWMERNFPLSRRRNRIIFFGLPIALVVIIVIIIVVVSYS